MRRVKRLISVILLMCMVATMLPAAAYAGEETEQYTEEFTEAESAEKAEQNTAETQVSESENITLYSSADSSGETELPEDSLCKVYIGKTGYSDIYTAVENAGSGDTIVLCDDIELSSRLTVDKSITIKDDGKARKIYCCNTATDKSGGYGRAIQVGSGKTLTISGTETGGLSFIGHDKEGSSYNKSSILYAFTGTLVINNNIEIAECQLTYGAGVICAGLVNDNNNCTATVELTGCHIHNNTSTSKNGGTAVYVYPGSSLYLNDGTVIENNSATSSVAGAVFNGTDAVTSISGNVIIKDNKKNCSYQENEGVSDDGTESNIQISSPDSLVINDNISGTIGIDYTGDNNGVFGKLENTSITGKDCLIEDSGNYSRVTYDSTGYLYWEDIAYSISSLNKTDISNYSYKLGQTDIILIRTSDLLGISITADSGNFTVPSVPENCTFIGIKNDNSYTNTFSAAERYKGITVYGFAGSSSEAVKDFIQSITFTTSGENMSQTVSIGLYSGSDSKYFGGSYYSYCGDDTSYNQARTNAENAGKYLATATSAAENAFINNIFKSSGWLGGAVRSGRWCWIGGPENGTVFGGNSSSSETYDGAYANWSIDEPNGKDYLYIGENGKWFSSDGNTDMGYYMESSDSCAVSVSNTVKINGGVTKLNALSPSFNGDIAMYYYFSFADSLLTGDSSYVSVKVGNDEPIKYSIKDLDKDPEYLDYIVKVPMSAKQMADNIEIKIFNGDNLITSYGGTGRINYNLRYYADKVIKLQSAGGSDKYNESFSYDIVQLVKAMLNYGAATQTQFNYNTDNPANYGYTDGIAEAPDSIDNTDDAFFYTDDDNNTVFLGAELIAQTDTILRIYLKSDYSVKVDGEAATVFTYNDAYYINIPVSSQNLSHIYSISANGYYLQINTYYD